MEKNIIHHVNVTEFEKDGVLEDILDKISENNNIVYAIIQDEEIVAYLVSPEKYSELN
jgi:hypothetical protein